MHLSCPAPASCSSKAVVICREPPAGSGCWLLALGLGHAVGPPCRCKSLWSPMGAAYWAWATWAPMAWASQVCAAALCTCGSPPLARCLAQRPNFRWLVHAACSAAAWPSQLDMPSVGHTPCGVSRFSVLPVPLILKPCCNGGIALHAARAGTTRVSHHLHMLAVLQWARLPCMWLALGSTLTTPCQPPWTWAPTIRSCWRTNFIWWVCCPVISMADMCLRLPAHQHSPPAPPPLLCACSILCFSPITCCRG